MFLLFVRLIRFDLEQTFANRVQIELTQATLAVRTTSTTRRRRTSIRVEITHGQHLLTIVVVAVVIVVVDAHLAQILDTLESRFELFEIVVSSQREARDIRVRDVMLLARLRLLLLLLLRTTSTLGARQREEIVKRPRAETSSGHVQMLSIEVNHTTFLFVFFSFDTIQ